MKVALGTIALVLATACASAWDNYGPSLYSVLRQPSVETVQTHLKILGEIIDNARKRDVRPPAGIQAEYAYYAWRLGKKEDARKSIVAEAEDYPEARTFLKVFERHLAAVTPITRSYQVPGGDVER